MQTIAMYQEPSAVVQGIPVFGHTFYADDPGVDHPTPPAPDRKKNGGKAKAKKKPASKGKKKKKK